MSAIEIGLVVFACVFGGSLVGAFVRPALPPHHLSEESKDVIRLGMGLVATMSALVLGLLIASAKSSFDAWRTGYNQAAVDFVLVDRTLAHYGPETQAARDLLRRTVVSLIAQLERTSSPESVPADVPATTAGGGALYDEIEALSPQTEEQRGLQAQALQSTVDLARTRWLLVEELAGSSIPMPYLVVLVFWLAVLFASFGLFAPPNATVVVTMLTCALSVSAAVFLIIELDRPLDGVIRISSGPLHNVLAQLGH
jgi:hypothetical protein